MGTPEFAVSSLDLLVQSGYNIIGVITSTDKLGGRGRKQLLESAVKKYALKNNLNILQPPNLKNPDFIAQLRALKADLQIVVAFRMLPEVVWNMPPQGTYNLHGSLLPKYRGAAPINWALIKGEEKTGVTSFKLKHEIDTGNIAFQEEIKINKTDNVQNLHDRMKIIGASVVLKTVQAIEKGTIVLKEQNESLVCKAPKIFQQDCQLDLSSSVITLYNYIRGLSPYPTSWTTFDQKKLKIFKATYSFENHKYSTGQFVLKPKKWLRLYCKDGYLDLKDIQLEGRKRMELKSFLNGFNIQENNLPFLLSD